MDHRCTLILLFLTLEGAYRVVAKRNKALAELKEQSENAKPEHPTRTTPDLYGKIKEVYFKSTSDGLYITLRVLIGNRGADTTIQPFVLKFLLNDREHTALQEDNVTDFSIVRPIDKPLWPSYSRETEAEELTDLSEDNLKPLERNGHREGWLRFKSRDWFLICDRKAGN